MHIRSSKTELRLLVLNRIPEFHMYLRELYFIDKQLAVVPTIDPAIRTSCQLEVILKSNLHRITNLYPTRLKPIVL